jgi:hypothetical protein
MLSLTRQWRSFSTASSKFLEGATKTASASAANALDPPKIVIARKKDIMQSPLKMKFLVSLVRKAWVPDALAQLKFTPKHRAIDIKKLILVSIIFLSFPFHSAASSQMMHFILFLN